MIEKYNYKIKELYNYWSSEFAAVFDKILHSY